MRHFVLVLSFVVSIESFAQTWSPGSIISATGDTTRGEIFFRDWDISPSSIDFRSGGQTSTMSDIKGFTIDKENRIYERVNIQLKYYFSVVSYGTRAVEREVPTNVFAEIVYYNSVVRLYSLGDDMKTERFLIRKNGQGLVELANYSYKVQRDGKIFQSDNHEYRGTLTYLLSDCNIKASDAMAYSEKEITRLLDKYGECNGASVKKKVDNRHLVNLGALVAVRNVPNWIPPYGNYNYETRNEPMVGLAIQFLSRKNFGNRFLMAELAVIRGPVDAGPGSLALAKNIEFAAYGGSFFGRKNLQGIVFIGASRYSGIFETGGGISYRKKFVLTASYGFLGSVDNAYSIKLRYHPRLKAPKS